MDSDDDDGVDHGYNTGRFTYMSVGSGTKILTSNTYRKKICKYVFPIVVRALTTYEESRMLYLQRFFNQKSYILSFFLTKFHFSENIICMHLIQNKKVFTK